jgi:hypothetical protein
MTARAIMPGVTTGRATDMGRGTDTSRATALGKGSRGRRTARATTDNDPVSCPVHRVWPEQKKSRRSSKPSRSGPELVAHHVAGASDGSKLLAEFDERGPIVVGKGDDVTLRPAHPRQLPKQHDRLPIADQ